MRWEDWYDSLRVGDVIVAMATSRLFAMAEPHIIVAKKTDYIRTLSTWITGACAAIASDPSHNMDLR